MLRNRATGFYVLRPDTSRILALRDFTHHVLGGSDENWCFVRQS